MKSGTVSIRTELKPGDIGYVTWLHGKLYSEEYNYGIEFESYVAAGLHEFHKQYNPERNRVWICEDGDQIVGFMLLKWIGERLRNFVILFFFPNTEDQDLETDS